MRSFFIDIINKFSTKKTLFIRLSKNAAEIKDIGSGESISNKSNEVFSNKRLIVADFIIAENFLSELIDELLNQKNKTFKKPLKIVLQIIDNEIIDVSNTEKAIYQDLMCHIGASNYWLIENQNDLSDVEILNITL
jgi:hypothetical protein